MTMQCMHNSRFNRRVLGGPLSRVPQPQVSSGLPEHARASVDHIPFQVGRFGRFCVVGVIHGYVPYASGVKTVSDSVIRCTEVE